MVVESGMAVRIQGLTINNVGNEATYTFAPAGTGVPGWTTAPTTFGTTYTYAGTIHENPTGHSTALTAIVKSGAVGSQPLWTDNTHNLMLMPQDDEGARGLTITDSKLDETLPLDGTKTYVTMVYRLRMDSHDLIGYEAASEHKAWTPESGIDANTPLHVKVAYPFSLTWEPGVGYLYNIAFNSQGATGGYLIDEYYYDINGDRTTLVVGDIDGDGDSEGPFPKDPVLGGDGEIHLIPVITPWDDTNVNIN